MEWSYMQLREQICDVCHKMWQLGWAAANDGNVSVKLVDGTFPATPTGISKSFITPEKLVRISKKGEVLEGPAAHIRGQVLFDTGPETVYTDFYKNAHKRQSGTKRPAA